MSKYKSFLKDYKSKRSKDEESKEIEKSYDYRDQYVIVDALDQQAAELSVPAMLNDYMQRCMQNAADDEMTDRHQGVYKIPFSKGTLTLSQKADNLYNGHFEDAQGQVVEKLSDVTMEIAAKTLMVKGFITKDDYEPAVAQTPQPVNPAPVIIEAPSDGPKSVRIKYGDFEFEMRKSVKDFVSNFKKSKQEIPSDVLQKAVRSWRRNFQFQKFSNDIEAARFILDNWEQEKEGFNQILFAAQQNQY